MRVALLGNPNSGKSTVFNGLTGDDQITGNWPGCTVEKREGVFEYNNVQIHLVDLPGVYALNDESSSEDEKITLNFLLQGEFDLILNIVDATNLERNLYLTCQLIELNVPFILIISKADLAASNGVQIDTNAITEAIGIKSLLINAKTKEGVELIKECIGELDGASCPQPLIQYPKEVYDSIYKISLHLQNYPNPEREAIRLLESAGAGLLTEEDIKVKSLVDKEKERLRAVYNEDSDIIIMGARYEFISNIAKSAIIRVGLTRKNISERLDDFILNPILSIPIFLLIMYLLFTFSITLSGIFQEFFELIAVAVFVKIPELALVSVGVPKTAVSFLSKGLGGGIATVASFIPVIWFLYFFLTSLENSGYMSRGAFVADRLIRKLGLTGKAFVPLVIGFGCNVPAIVSTRILENRRDRIVTIMMSPFMSCSARLSVYALFCAAFFKENGSLIVFLLYLIGIIAAILTGFILKRFIVKGPSTHFIMELPPYSFPSLREVISVAGQRTKGFVFGAGKLIVIVYFFVSIFASVNSKGNFVTNISGSVLADAGKAVVPIFQPMGINANNWPAAVSILTGTLAKEVVVGTLNALYEEVQEEETSLEYLFKSAFVSVYRNTLSELKDFINPLWFNFSHLDIGNSYPEVTEVSGLTSKLYDNFDSKISVFAYLLFILLYFPCVSVFAVIAEELSWKWAIASATWSTLFAYCAAVLTYQALSLIF